MLSKVSRRNWALLSGCLAIVLGGCTVETGAIPPSPSAGKADAARVPLKRWVAEPEAGLFLYGTGAVGVRAHEANSHLLAWVGDKLVTGEALSGGLFGIRLRNPEGLTVESDIPLPFAPFVAANVPGGFLVSGIDQTDPAADPGVVKVGPAGKRTELAMPTSPRTEGSIVYRSLIPSTSGKTLVSGLCDGETCAVDLIDPVTDVATRLANTSHGPLTLTDSVLVTVASPPDLITALDAKSGRELWHRADGEYQHIYAASDEILVVGYVGGPDGGLRYRLAQLDMLTGNIKELINFEVGETALWPELSDANVAVLGPAYSLGEGLAARSSASVSLLTLATGVFSKDAGQIVVADR